jgi:glycosyltransferase involved in cell wall biosynthesis
MIDELSVIIPALNEEHYLPRLLQSIAEQNYQGNLEIIVVDGGSKDKTVNLANGFKKQLKQLTVITTNKGISRQRNVGADRAKYKYLMFLDSDTYLPQKFLFQITQKINPDKIFIANPLILPMDGNIIDSAFVFMAYVFLLGILLHIKPSSAGMCLITTKENHHKINGFNEKAVCGEDIDYGLRSIKAGAKYRFYFNPHMYASVRRRKQIGRFKLAIIWMHWYIDNVTHGAITNSSKYEYSFGNH